MNLIEKVEAKKALFHSLGCDADDWLDGAKKQAAGCEGAKQAVRKAAKDVQALAEVITKDLDEGKLEGKGPLEVAEYAKLQVTRAVNSLLTVSQHYENLQLSALGEIAAYEKMVGHFKKLHDSEETRVAQIKQALVSGALQVEEDGSLSQREVSTRTSGVRPATSIAAQRKAEEAATKSNGKAQKTSKAPKKPRKCGHCGKPGHTARTCPNAPDA